MKSIVVQANQPETKTGILVNKKDVLSLSVIGIWKDAGIECDADGWTGESLFPYISFLYDNPFVDSLKQSPGKPYMKLMGKVGDISFEIGNSKSKAFIMPSSGELILFPNDIPWLYWNNSGNITVTVF